MGRPKTDLSDSILKWENLVKSGQGGVVRNEIFRCQLTKIPHHQRRAIANLLRRIGEFHAGLKVLMPVIFHEDQSLRNDRKIADVAEYSVLLLKAGMPDSALEMLKGIDANPIPEAILYKAFCYIGTWRAELAIPLLETYIGMEQVPHYQRLLAEVNLLNCLVTERHLQRALTLSESLISVCEEQKLIRLKGNCLELKANALIETGDFATAKQTLGLASQTLEQDTGRYKLQIKKWLAFLEASASGDPEALSVVRREAEKSGADELVREVDVLRLRVRFDHKLFSHLIFGSRSEDFRRKTLAFFKEDPAPIGEKLSTQPHARWQLDLRTGELNGKTLFPPGKKLHKLVFTLGSERYSHSPVGALHSLLSPGEYYDPSATPLRVAQLITRVRKKFAALGVPATIEENNGGYKLRLSDEVGLTIPYENQSLQTTDLMFEQIYPHLNGGPATRADVCKWLDVSTSNARRLINAWIETGKLEPIGHGASTKYQLKPRGLKSA